MKRFTIFFLSLFILNSCEKEEQIEIDKKLLDGIYVGTFQREYVWIDSDTANITITFSSNKWSGSSDIDKYPALCSGTYSICGDTIVFENECVWTTEFDWSLILSGKNVYEESKNTIEFHRDYRGPSTDTYIDRYKLTRQE